LLLVEGQLKVADFGLCRAMRLKGTGRFRGTPPYAAPELYEGRPTRHTDQYALAVTFCELVAADRMFHKPEPKQAQAAVRQGYPGPPIDFSKSRAREWPILARALDPNWISRWPSCREFIAALRKAVEAPRSKLTIPFRSIRAAAERNRAETS
jgi:serine/threonine protein kinase